MKIFLFIFLFLPFQHVFAQGGWVSSGGELFRDGKNPWYVKNTMDVNYCIRHDEQSFSASLSQIRESLKNGFSYWKDEFSRNPSPGIVGYFQVGTQNFHEVACDNSPDIEFLFGYKTLNPLQLKSLKDPKKYIGVTVRTDYDLKTLKAKGFIYFSSDLNEFAYDNPGSLIQQAWKRPKILQYAIMHELGHIFGLPHMGTGLMSEVFLNQILEKNLVEIYEKYPVESFLSPPQNIESCSSFTSSMQWFEGSSKNTCLMINIDFSKKTWPVFTRKDANAKYEELGEIRNITSDFLRGDQRGKPALLLQITSEQKVFSPQETAFRSFMLGPLMKEEGLNATYISKVSGKPQSIYMNINPMTVTIQGFTIKNKVETVFSYSSPFATLMLIPPTP